MNELVHDTIPQVIDSPFMKDVTNEYMETTDVKVKIGRKAVINHHFMYLAISAGNNGSWSPGGPWEPVAYSTINEDSTAFFPQMGRGIVYLPIALMDNFKHQVMSYPILVEPNGNVRQLIPSKDKSQTEHVIITEMPNEKNDNLDPIAIGDQYSLFCYGEYGEGEAGEKVATSNQLEIINLPRNALFRIEHRIKNEWGYRYESRLFTVENGKVRWY